MSERQRRVQLAIRVSQEALDGIDALAARHDVSRSDVLRAALALGMYHADRHFESEKKVREV